MTRDDRRAHDPRTQPPGAHDSIGQDDDFAPEEMSMLRTFFRDEAQDALDKMTAQFLDTGATAPHVDTVTELMRITHTLKGSAGTVGLSDMVDFAHELEGQLARLRDGSLAWSVSVHDQLIDLIDAVRGYVDTIGTETDRDLLAARIASHLDVLRGPLPVPSQAEQGAPRAPSGPLDRAPRGASHRDRRQQRRPRPERSPSEPPLFDIIDALEHFDDTTRSIIADTTSDDIRADDRGVLRVDSKRIDQLMDSVGELILDRTRLERRVKSVRGVARELERARQSLGEEARALQELSRTHPELERIARAIVSIDENLHANMQELAHATGELVDGADALKRTAAHLQTGLTRVRMSSAKSLFQTLARQLRGIARDALKKVRLRTSGEDTEFDKTVAERITDPLIQLLRNAVAHGIEPEEARVALGKNPIGEVHISAHQQGSLVVLELSDDGAGIDPAALRERFVQAGRWSRTKADLASDEEVLRAIFDAGVSTRENADHLAGRGVGLDAVRETIARLGGEIRMTSTPGKGTTFTMRLPVSAAVSQAMLFKLHHEVFAVPYVHVVETARLVSDDVLPETIPIREGRIPLIDTQHLLAVGTTRAEPPSAPANRVIVLEYAGQKFAMTCEKIIGPREIVVKDLGPLLAPLPLYGGATLSGSGKVQLILDTAALARLAYPEVPSLPSAADDEELAQSFDSEDSVSTVFHRALVADDSKSIREATTHFLAEAGYIVDTAEDGAAAWRMLSEGRYDLVVTDIEMPNLDGFGLIERIRGDARMAEKPVVLMTSRNSDADRRRARELAVRSFVQKPITRRKLIDALKTV